MSSAETTKPTTNGHAKGAHAYWLPEEVMAMSDAERGHWFHERLEAEKLRLGRDTPVHEDDPGHDEAVGRAIALTFAGHVVEALQGYNAWAAGAGYARARIVARHPELLIDIADGIVKPTAGGFDLVDAPDRTVAIQRSFDPEVLNAVVNDPAVYPWVHGGKEGPLDLTDIVKDPRNVLLAGEHGSMLFMPMAPGLWELHTQVLPSGRGAWTLGLGASAFGWMFTHTDAVEVLTRVPVGNVGAASAVRRAGFSEQWSQADGWVYEGKDVGVGIWSWTLQQWLRSEFAIWLDTMAEDFLAVLAPGVETRADAIRPLGYALAAIRGRQALKGCVFLNRWGAIAGFPPAFVASTDPLTVSLGGGLFGVSPEGEITSIATSH